MDYTPEELAYVQTLTDAYQAILEATVTILGTTDNPAIMYIAVDTLQDMAEEIGEINGIASAYGIDTNDSTVQAMATAAPYLERIKKAKDTQGFSGAFLPRG